MSKNAHGWYGSAAYGPGPDTTDECHNLCRKCGFCCDGTLFKKVQLEEQDDASKLLLFQITSVEDTFYFHQPCFVFDHLKGCRIYDARPIKCKEFACKLLLLLRNKELSLQAATGVIEQTKQAKSDLIKEALRKNIDRKYLQNTKKLVDHIASDLSSQEHKLNYKDVLLKCAAFSENLLKYFEKDQPVE